MSDNVPHPQEFDSDPVKLGQAALQRGDVPEAIRIFDAVLDRVPNYLPALIGHAMARAMQGDLDTAVASLTDLLKLKPDHLPLFDALGVIHFDVGRFDEAETWFRKGLRLGGFFVPTACNLGMTLIEQGRYGEAETVFKRCVRRDPESAAARYHLGLLQLLRGEYLDGWRGFDLRHAVAGRHAPEAGRGVRWSGEPLDGKSILLLAEQGLGDTINFARYGAVLAGQGADVYLKCAAPLAELLKSLPGVRDTSASADSLPETDYFVPLLSVPGLLETTPETIPLANGYLPAPENRALWVERLSTDGDLHVGLVWAGNPDNKVDRKRSLSLQVLAPLFERQDVKFYSLQVGDAAGELDDIPVECRPVNLFPEPLPFTEAAAAVSALDLLISVDSAPAHLAGALSVPVWTLLPHVPDWRWGLDGEETPWYVSMRLFRQPAIGDWETVVRNLSSALDNFPRSGR